MFLGFVLGVLVTSMFFIILIAFFTPLPDQILEEGYVPVREPAVKEEVSQEPVVEFSSAEELEEYTDEIARQNVSAIVQEELENEQRLEEPVEVNAEEVGAEVTEEPETVYVEPTVHNEVKKSTPVVSKKNRKKKKQ